MKLQRGLKTRKKQDLTLLLKVYKETAHVMIFDIIFAMKQNYRKMKAGREICHLSFYESNKILITKNYTLYRFL